MRELLVLLLAFVTCIQTPLVTATSGRGNSWCRANQHWVHGGLYQQINTEYWNQVPFKVDAPEEYSGIPQGCTCVNDIQSDAECTVFKCDQSCNLNRGKCDRNCCSDPDCTEAEIEKFKAAKECIQEPAPFQVEKCQLLGTLEQVNAKYRMHKQIFDDPIDRILCVTIDNNPIKGTYYNTPSQLLGTPEVLDDPSFRESFSSFEGGEDSITSLGTGTGYETGDPIVAAIVVQTIGAVDVLEPLGSGVLPLPVAGPGGECIDSTFVRYGMENGYSQCTRIVLGDPSVMCGNGTMISTTLFENYIRIGSTPQASRSTPGTFTSVELGELRVRDLETGLDYKSADLVQETTPVPAPTSSPSLAPTTAPVASNNSTRRFLATNPLVEASTRLETFWDEASNTCVGAVVGVKYKLQHDAAGLIASAVIDLTIANVTMARSTATDPIGFQQEFEVEFESTSKGNETGIPRIVSGNPGYLVGYPVLAGKETSINSGLPSEKSAVLMNLEGLSIPGAQGTTGSCFDQENGSWWNQLGSDRTSRSDASKRQVSFGVNMQTSCSVEMSYDDFVNHHDQWCTDFTSLPSFNLTDQLIGLYGNSDPLKLEEWIPVQSDTSSLVPTLYSPVAGDMNCQNVASDFRLQILWADTGEKLNPQPMILAARVEYVQRNWKWTLPPGADRRLKFLISRTVTFIQYKGSSEEIYKPQVPPLLPAIPTDVFYPFDIRASSSNSWTPTFSQIAFIVMALLLLL